MEALYAIRHRRSISNMKELEVPKEIIEQILEAATWAPNRYLTEPWRFFVITGEGRKRLSDVMVDIVKDSDIDLESEEGKSKLEKEKKKPFRAPVIVAVAAEVSTKDKVIRLEELGATYAAIQNLLLAAFDLGVSSYWKTGSSCYSAKMKRFFKLEDKDEVLGFIYLGYSDAEKKEPHRKSAKSLTKWIKH